MSGVTDCYQPVERKLQITRRCLEVLAEFHNPVTVVTKNHLVTRDLDILRELAAVEAACVNLSITTLDAGLARRLEPRASLPRHRLEAIECLSSQGIPARRPCRAGYIRVSTNTKSPPSSGRRARLVR